MLFGCYLILNGLERYLIEGIRVNIKYDVAGAYFTQARIIAIFLIIAGLILCGWTIWKYRKSSKAERAIRTKEL